MINLLSHTLAPSARLPPPPPPPLSPPPPPPHFFLQPGVDPPQNPSEAATVLLCLHPSLPPSFSLSLLLPPRPAPDDAGWRGRRHASTGTRKEERKGGNEGRREGEIGEKYVGGGGGGEKKGRGLIVNLFQALFLSCAFLSIQHYMRGASQSVFVESGEVATPSLNPPTPVDWELKKSCLRTTISGLDLEANFKTPK